MSAEHKEFEKDSQSKVGEKRHKNWEKAKLDDGTLSQMRLKTDTETMNNFKYLLSVFGATRPIAMRNLYAWYMQNQDLAERFLKTLKEM